MGTTLTGTTPQDTYDSLIKVTDNGPISGTLKALSDGLGNDSTLSLSTTAASIAGTLAVTGNATFDTNTLFVNASTERVGIGTITPADKLSLLGTDTTAYVSSSVSAVIPAGGVNLTIQNNGTAGYNSLRFVSLDGSNAFGYLGFINNTGVSGSFVFGQRTGGNSYAEQMRISEVGNVGIGTSSPETKLNLVGGNIRLNTGSGTVGTSSSIEFSASANNSVVSSEIRSPRTTGGGADLQFFTTTSVGVAPTEKLRILEGGGITFNGDTAAANALDDYEEGTWTMGVSFDGASVGVTYSSNTGTYTKIGRQVTVNGFLALTSKGSSTGRAKITGLPFTIPNNVANYGAASLWFNAITFANQLLANGVINETTIELEEITEAGVRTGITEADFANNTSMIVNFTYFV